jgi:hypothetical protein
VRQDGDGDDVTEAAWRRVSREAARTGKVIPSVYPTWEAVPKAWQEALNPSLPKSGSMRNAETGLRQAKTRHRMFPILSVSIALICGVVFSNRNHRNGAPFSAGYPAEPWQ